MLGLVLAALALQKPVVLPSRAMRLDALLKELSNASGVTCRAGRNMGPRIVLVAGPPRPAAAIRADLAMATFGRWRAVGNEWMLDEDPTAMREREARRLSARIAQVKAQQAKMRSEIGPPLDLKRARELSAALDTFDKSERDHPNEMTPQMQKAEALKFSRDAVRRIVVSLDPTEIAALERGRVVYSDQPTRLQRPLPAKLANEVVARMSHDQTVWATVFADSAGWIAGRRNGYLTNDPRAYTDAVVPGATRLFVKADAFEHGQTMFTVRFLDAKGTTRQFGDVSFEFNDRDQRTDPSPAVDPKEPPIPLSDTAKAYSDAQRGRGASPLLRPILLWPERREPLDILFGEGLRGVAKARKQSVVAWLNDDVAREGLGPYRGKGTEPSASGWLRAAWLAGCEVQDGPTGIVIRPRLGDTNVDRALVGPIARTIERLGYLPLDDAADYAFATDAKGHGADPLAMVLFENAQPGSFQITFRTDWSTLALWGGFSRAQRASLLSRGTVPWTAVPKIQHDRLIAAILDSDSNELSQSGPQHSSLDTEPTEVLANGAGIGEGVVGMGQVQEAVFVKSTDENPYNGGLASASSLASAVMSREKEPDVIHYDGLPKVLPDGFLLGREIDLGFTIDLAPTLRWQKYGQFGEIDLRARPVPLESMPESFRKKYDQALEGYRKQRANG